MLKLLVVVLLSSVGCYDILGEDGESEHIAITVADKCGLRTPNGFGFRVKENPGNEAEDGEFPWMMAVLKEVTTSKNIIKSYLCGGSLIHPSVVLTAAHCVVGKAPSSLQVRAGEWDITNKSELFPHVDALVDSIVVHEDYNSSFIHYNNIALLFLKTPIANAENINTICLPPQDTNFDKSSCFSSGWVKDIFGYDQKKRYQPILKKIEVPVVSFESCQKSLEKSTLDSILMINKSFICAGGERGKESCNGDGGSPLVCPVPGHDGHYYLAGIVATEIGCGETGVPGVYVNVSGFRNWIDQQLSTKGFNSQSYSI